VTTPPGTADPQNPQWRRWRQVRALWQAHGLRGLAAHARGALARRVAPAQEWLPVGADDLLAADLSRPFDPPRRPWRPDEPLVIDWVCTPPGADFGFGGHATLFRIVNFLGERGHLNRLYLHDVYCGDLAHQTEIVRRQYGFRGPVARVQDGMEDAHAVVATGWPTAYPVFNARCSGRRCYLVQDFEPDFHPMGSLAVLAENTYRMGFHGITAGPWLAERLRRDYGMAADAFDLGCDLERYRRTADMPRRGIAFYARPRAARRGFEVGMLALELFARRRPDLEIHLFGAKVGTTRFRCIDHGPLSPAELNRLYNRCHAGLSLSLTNVSLVPLEMLAAGCIPVVNDAEHTRRVLDNAHVSYADFTPHALAARLEAIVGLGDFDAVSRAAAASVRRVHWEQAGATVEQSLRRVVSEEAPPRGTDRSARRSGEAASA
jgi:hypothetical protein